MMWKPATAHYSGSLAVTLALALGSLSTSVQAWSISGTVKSNTGASLAGVAVTVKDSSKYSTTTDGNGNFSFQSTGILSNGTRFDAFSVQLAGRDLTVRSPVDGPLQLALVDASGRSIWAAEAIAHNGLASASLPTSLRSGAIFLRIRHAGGVEYQAVKAGAEGLQMSPAHSAARAMADNPVLIFKKSGYDSATYTMQSETATGITVTMKTSDPGVVCDLPATYKWKDYGKPIAEPKNGWLAIKDFTMVRYNNQYLVYMTNTPSQGGFNASYMAPFADFPQAAAAAQYSMPNGLPGVAPEFMYFAPKSQWVFSTQWCGANGYFCYTTGSDPTKPANFAAKSGGQMQPLLKEKITDAGKDPIDHTIICDDANCYLFYADDNGRIYRGSMPKANFPSEFKGTKKILTDEQLKPEKLFEAVQVYKLKGQKKYLMIVECGWTRYFRAFLADDLGGAFKPIANTRDENTPFAGAKNVSNGWSKDISHGDIVRSSYDEFHEIDPCNLQMIYQGLTSGSDYSKLPYRMGLITLQR